MLTLQGIALLLAASVAVAAIVRATRCPGWPIVGGIVAGILIGPTILGRAMPETFERLYVGGMEQHDIVQMLRSDDALQRGEGKPHGVPQEELDAAAAERARKIAEAQSNLSAARWADQRPLRWLTFALVGVTLLAAGTLGERPGPHAHPPMTSMSIGAWSAALPGALAFAVATWFGFPFEHRLIAASAVGIGAWTLRSADRDAADHAELGGGHMLQTATRVASVFSLSALAWALWLASGWGGLKWMAPVVLLPVGWILPAPAVEPGLLWKSMRVAVLWIAAPAMAAACAIKLDLIEHFSIWLVLLFIILSGDARMLGAFIGARIVAPRRALRAMRMVVGVMAAGPTQLAVLAMALHTNNIDPELGAALLLGAMLIELFTPLRKSFARRVVEIESNLEETGNQVDQDDLTAPR